MERELLVTEQVGAVRGQLVGPVRSEEAEDMDEDLGGQGRAQEREECRRSFVRCSGGGGKGCIKGCGQAEDKGAERIVSVRKSGKGCGAGGGIEEDGEVGRAAEGEGDAVAVEGGRVVKHAHAFR